MQTVCFNSIARVELAFDVGHSSIGWAAFSFGGSSIDVLGCGSVIFGADDCLASIRRGYRRQRRQIRSTRKRIHHLKLLLKQYAGLTEAELRRPGCSWPWKLAAQVLQQNCSLLTWVEMWDVLRWYAHNRGYDGNCKWASRDQADAKEDSEKESNARALMAKHRVNSMAEALCKELGVDPQGVVKSSTKRLKGPNAFPRVAIESEVRRILELHINKLPGLNEKVVRAILDDWRVASCPEIKLSKRYAGGLLFGQLIPQFDNRIISQCPITFSREFDKNLAKGLLIQEAVKKARTMAKVPSRNCWEFFEFRWAMKVADVRGGYGANAELQPLGAEHRKQLNDRIRRHGYFTAKEFKDSVREITGCKRDNLDTLLLHPDAGEALLVDPVQKLITSKDLEPIWKLLPERMQKRLRGHFRRGKQITLAQIRSQLESFGDTTSFDSAVAHQVDIHNTNARKKGKQITKDEILLRSFGVDKIKGRAPYARSLLKQAVQEVKEGKLHPSEQGGCLYLSEDVRKRQLQLAIDQQTNNHLVRHRLLILEKLLGDLIKEYAQGQKERIGQLVIEVNRDLRSLSGKTAKEIAQEMMVRVSNHHDVVKKLEKAFGAEPASKSVRISAGLIRKARIAEDLGWICPYTGDLYEPKDLITRAVDKDHIVPRSERASDSLDSLVITFAEVNRWKGKRTALQFIQDEQGKTVPGMPRLTIRNLQEYKKFVEDLETRNGHDDDQRRKKHRKELMLLSKYEEKEFTPRDLTQTSQIVRLGAQVLKRYFADLPQSPSVILLPGSVTGTVRKAWKVLGCLSQANARVLDETGNVKIKSDIRDITHLHHALDACVLGLAVHFIPNNGRVWELILKRNPNDAEKRELKALGVLDFGDQGRFEMKDLAASLKQQIRQRLAEKRVVQHLPSDVSGLQCKETIWRVFDSDDTHPNSQRLARWLKKGGIDIPSPDAKTVLIICRKRRDASDSDKKSAGGKVFHEGNTWTWVYDIKDKSALLGLAPEKNEGKLKQIKAVKVLGDNWGLALDPEPTLIRPYKIWHQLKALREQHGNKFPRVLRKGSLIRIKEKAARSDYRGIWMVRGVSFSQKNGLLLDLSPADYVSYRQVEGAFQHVSVATLIKCGLEVIRVPLCGICPKRL